MKASGAGCLDDAVVLSQTWPKVCQVGGQHRTCSFQGVHSNVPGAAGPSSAASALSWSGWCRSGQRWGRWASPRAPSWPQWHHPPAPAGPQQAVPLKSLAEECQQELAEQTLHLSQSSSVMMKCGNCHRKSMRQACLAGCSSADASEAHLEGVRYAWRHGSTLVHQELDPLLDQASPELAGEGASIADKCCCQQHVTREHLQETQHPESVCSSLLCRARHQEKLLPHHPARHAACRRSCAFAQVAAGMSGTIQRTHATTHASRHPRICEMQCRQVYQPAQACYHQLTW